MSNLPDDWGSYTYICNFCGQSYHASGCDECACIQCSRCNDNIPPDDQNEELSDEEQLCFDCAKRDYCEGCLDEFEHKNLMNVPNKKDDTTEKLCEGCIDTRDYEADKDKTSDILDEYIP